MVAAARAAAPGAPPPARVAVGVITPYRQQALCLRDAFARVVGPEAAAEVTRFPPLSNTSWGPEEAELCSDCFVKCRWRGKQQQVVWSRHNMSERRADKPCKLLRTLRIMQHGIWA